MGLTNAGGQKRWNFLVYGTAGTAYDPDPMRFLQITPDETDPVGAYAAEGANGQPDPQIGSGSVGEWP